jgi:2-polyprenyl-3-methyl-5-hydroxy-6-metoxy-1,4-benzoquinol methylase
VTESGGCAEISWRHVPCPLCGADAPRHLATDRVWRAGCRHDFHIVRCALCRFVYVTPRAAGPIFGAEPGGAARRDAAVANRPIYARGLAALRLAGLSPDGHILDVGCARGDFLAFAAQRGYRVTGVDINPGLSAEAAARGWEVQCADLRAWAPSDAFDAVTLWDVIEHVDDPVSMLRVCREAVHPGGLVLFHTGNAAFQIPKARILSSIRPDSGPYLIPYQHLTHFDPVSARRALATTGLDPVAVFFAGTLHYRQCWKRLAMGAINLAGCWSYRLGGPLLTNALAAIGRRPLML